MSKISGIIGVNKACMDYMMANGIEPSSWKITDKSLVYYEDNKRTVIPIKNIMEVA